jgi:hypothetical protein
MAVRSIVMTAKAIQRRLAGLLAGADTLSNERTRLPKTPEPPFGLPTGAWQCAPLMTPERMFCEHRLTYAYCFSRHSYSAIGAALG